MIVNTITHIACTHGRLRRPAVSDLSLSIASSTSVHAAACFIAVVYYSFKGRSTHSTTFVIRMRLTFVRFAVSATKVSVLQIIPFTYRTIKPELSCLAFDFECLAFI